MNRLLRSSWLVVGWLVASSANVAWAQTAPAAAPADTDDIEISATPAPPTAVTPAAAPAPVSAAPATAASVTEAKTTELELRLQALEAQQQAAAAAAKAAHEEAEHHDALFGQLAVRAYAQAQYESSQLSEDQLQPGGTPINRDRFAVRTARILVTNTWDYAALAAELDANTLRSSAFGIRQAHGSVFFPNESQKDAPHYAELTLGLQDIPFGFELPYGSRRRIFAERSQASRAFFPGEPDIGAVVHGGAGPFRYALAVMNGNPLDDRNAIPAADPNAAKDVIGRVGVEAQPKRDLVVSGGVSFLSGTGFHAGSEAKKNTITWTDSNEDGSVQSTEVTGSLGSAQTPSKNFKRWAIGADAQAGLHTSLGWSRLYAEVTLASNLDRGLFVADPIAASQNTRELGYYVAFVQEVTPYGLFGFRTDFYDGDSDFVDHRRGQVIPANQSVRTFSPLIGVVLPDRARLTLQYDIVDDSFARDMRGVPTDVKNNQWTLRLQVGL